MLEQFDSSQVVIGWQGQPLMDRVCFCSIPHSGPVKNFSGSSYIFYRSNGNWYNWERSKKICEQSGYNLVSIESREEWNFLNQTIQKMETIAYFIGLRKDTSTGVWRWLSDNSTVNASNQGEWPWATREPNGKNGAENCAHMYRDYLKDFGRYNDFSCTSADAKSGFICEFRGGGGNRPLIHITRNL